MASNSPLDPRPSPLDPRSSSVVHVVDDDESFLKAVSRLLRVSGFTVKTFDSATALLAQVSPETRGCVIADLRMPGVSGLDLQDALGKACLTLPVIFLTGEGDIPSSVRAMRHGAEDFLEKRAPKARLLDAVNRALDRDARECAERTRLQALRTAFDALSPRELEVLAHVVRGQLNKQIAADLNLSESTVKTHRGRITTKLHVYSVAELTRLTQEAGLFDAGATTSTKGQ